MHVGLLASDGCFSSALTALIDVLSTAEAERPGVDPSIPAIRVDVTGTGRKVTTGAGLTVPVTMHLRELPAVDVVVVPALGTMTAEDTLGALAARTTRAIISAVGDLDPGTTTVAAACTGRGLHPRRVRAPRSAPGHDQLVAWRCVPNPLSVRGPRPRHHGGR